ncbi:FkbM family methyltransferase [Vulcanococcus limneticus]|uniref:FkbM family methyltransferase n=1 Tax=Vulcanococcus limneticus TaxID=2170428 RepID=UPI00398BEFF5
MQCLRRYLRQGDLCADIGASVGLYSLLMARTAGAGNVQAFECLPGNIRKLHANLRLNGFDGPEGVVVHDLALADPEGLVRLNVSDGDSTASISPPEADGETPGDHSVQARRLDGFPWPAHLPTSRSTWRAPSSWCSPAVSSCYAARPRWCGASSISTPCGGLALARSNF